MLVIVGLIGGGLIVYFDPETEKSYENFITYSLAGALTVPSYFLIIGVSRAYLSRMTMIVREQVAIQNKTESLQEAIEEDFFNNLVKINFKYIDKYYLQTQIQADKSFWLALIAAIVGFSVMITGIVLMYIGKTTPGYVSAASGLVSQFIAGVFFYLYNKTIISMAGYHRKLVLTQNIGLALRITEDLPDEHKIAARLQLVDRLSSDINSLLATEGDRG